MKEINDIMSQIDDLQALPVSEEMIGSYVEGRLNPLEELEVQQICAGNRLADAVVLSSRQETPGMQSDFINDVERSMLDEMDFELPVLPTADVDNIHDNSYFPAKELNAAFENPSPTFFEEEQRDSSPFQDYADTGSDDLDDPFSEDFLQSE